MFETLKSARQFVFFFQNGFFLFFFFLIYTNEWQLVCCYQIFTVVSSQRPQDMLFYTFVMICLLTLKSTYFYYIESLVHTSMHTVPRSDCFLDNCAPSLHPNSFFFFFFFLLQEMWAMVVVPLISVIIIEDSW